MNEPDHKKSPLYLTDGCIVDRNCVYVTGKTDHQGPDDRGLSILYWCLLEPEGWQWPPQAKGSTDVVSVCCHKPEDTFFALGRNGEVHVEGRPVDPVVDEQIPDAGIEREIKLGAMTQIRQIGRSVFACGHHGQVYRRTDQGWVHIDEQILDQSTNRPLSLNGIDGSAEDDLFVVGYHGRILHFNGRDWTELDSPTNLHLERVCSVGRGEAYVCGNEGTLLRITTAGIEDLSIETDEHFWGLTVFEGRAYAATLSTLYMLEGDELEEIDVGLGDSVGFYRLDSGDGVLWSFGPEDLLRFDGDSWERVPFPDNE